MNRNPSSSARTDSAAVRAVQASNQLPIPKADVKKLLGVFHEFNTKINGVMEPGQ